MMKFYTITVTVWATFASFANADSIECGPSGASFAIAGSSTVFPMAQLWAQAYMKICSGINITVEGGGSSEGAMRVCASDDAKGGPVSIGDMSREWFDKEALPAANGYLYQCVIGDTTRSAIQVDVAIDGLSVAVLQNGTAAQCIELLGGLSTDQLRWIYTSYDADQLLATGWDSSSVPNSDDDESTHLWSELDSRCAPIDIKIAGPDPESGTFEYFLQTILVDLSAGETYDPTRPGGYFNSTDDEVIVRYTESDGDVVAFFGYAYFLKDESLLYAVPIMNDEGDFVVPNPETVSDGTYNPLSRRIYMNLLNDADSLGNTLPFLRFCYSANGTVLVDDTGYVPIDESERELLLARFPDAGKALSVTPLTSPSEAASPSAPSKPTAPSPSAPSSSGVYIVPKRKSFLCLVLIPLTVLFG
jgi:phosphate transport system substrate-binding protein